MKDEFLELADEYDDLLQIKDPSIEDMRRICQIEDIVARRWGMPSLLEDELAEG